MNMLKKNRPFFLFLLKFALSYLLLSVVYSWYLNNFDTANFEPDGMTTLVSKQSVRVVEMLGHTAEIAPHPKEASWYFFVNGKRLLRIVEGCNALSVMILFAAFIIAFSTTFKRTVIYILIGLLLLHILNVVRIALLGMGFYYYPAYGHFMHDILFPLFIYGVVFLLWILWVLKFSKNGKETTAQ